MFDDKYYEGKYRINSARLKNYDYSKNGLYFVTICTDDRRHFFGKIVNEKMILNQLGVMADKYWLEIPTHFTFVELDEYIIMPNHVHGVVVINNGDKMADGEKNIKNGFVASVETPKLGVSTVGIDTKCKYTTDIDISPKKPGGHNPEWKSGTLGVIINQYKRKCTIEIRKIHPISPGNPDSTTILSATNMH
jgi:putative transposase